MCRSIQLHGTHCTLLLIKSNDFYSVGSASSIPCFFKAPDLVFNVFMVLYLKIFASTVTNCSENVLFRFEISISIIFELVRIKTWFFGIVIGGLIIYYNANGSQVIYFLDAFSLHFLFLKKTTPFTFLMFSNFNW